MTFLAVPPIEKELVDNKINEIFSMDAPFLEFDSFIFEASNIIPTIDVNPRNLIDQHKQEGIDGEKIKDIPHPNRQIEYEAFSFDYTPHQEERLLLEALEDHEDIQKKYEEGLYIFMPSHNRINGIIPSGIRG